MKINHEPFELIDRSGTGSVKWDLMRAANPNVPPGVAPMSTADLDIPLSSEIRDGLIEYLATGVVGYTVPTDGLLAAIQMWNATRHKWAISTSWIATMPGVVTGLYAAVRALTEPGDGVILMTPAYPPMFDAIKQTKRRLVDVPLEFSRGRYRLDLDALEQAAQGEDVKAIMLCSPHNPTSRVWTLTELEVITGIAEAHGLSIISDEIHSDLIMDKYEHIPCASISEDAAARTITVTAASKSFNLAGMSTSYAIIANEDLRARYNAELASWGYHFPPAIGAKATELAYMRAGEWLAELLALIAQHDKLSREFFAAYFPEVVIAPLEGTYLQWLDFRALGFSAQELERIHTQEAFVYFDEGHRFGAPGFERLNLGTPTKQLREALNRLRIAYGR